MASQPHSSTTPALQILDPEAGCGFITPVKRINDGDDVSFFLASRGYASIMTFIFQLNTAMVPRKADTQPAKEWKLNDPDVVLSPLVQNLGTLLSSLTSIIDEAPPDPGPRRFGNASFRTWYDLVRARVSGLLEQHLPPNVLAFKSTSSISARSELEAYLIGSFGSSQRLDYGTGHELSFLAFLACLWKLGAFPASTDGDQERGIVLGVIEPYLVLIRRLILTYTLEPAGSHGVWGLDDHSFLPYIFGSAQLSPAITNPADLATEGSLPNATNPADVAKANVVDRERKRNMYFSAIGFINDVKKGPFWEHSPILYDISGVQAGWAKINKGMIKMYNAEVLSKFPVVQHFPFGSLFAWEKDPNAKAIQASVHTSSQPKAATPSSTAPTARQPPPPLRDPRASPSSMGMPAPSRMPPTAAPWATQRAGAQGAGGTGQTTRAPWAAGAASSVPAGARQPPGSRSAGAVTTAPWAKRTEESDSSSTDAAPPGDTKAPWAS